MENLKRAIILDMDGTLEYGIYQSKYDAGDELIMVIRPNLDKLIVKLKEAKKQGIDIILCTTASNIWVETFLNLKPDFRNIFDKKYTRDNEIDWLNYSKEKYPLEYKAKTQNINLEYSKPITTFGYDQVLFIDDSKIECLRLQMLFELTQGKLEKNVTYFSGYGFNGGSIAWDKILGYKKASVHSVELYHKLNEYLDTVRDDIGCKIMCSVIDTFMKKEFKAGLSLVDDEYLQEYELFNNEIKMLHEELEVISSKLDKKLFEYTEIELKQFIKTDKHYPYEGL